MKLMNHEAFGRLRLSQFLHSDSIAPLANWKFMGHIWLGEAVRFSQWLRLESDAQVLRSLSIDFQDFPADQASRVLETLGIPVERGMSLAQITQAIGDPVHMYRPIKDRSSCEFSLRQGIPYDVQCAVLDDGGLTYLVMTVPLSDG